MKDSEVEFAAGLAVRGAHEVPGAAAARAELVEQHVPAGLAEQDADPVGPGGRAGGVDPAGLGRHVPAQPRPGARLRALKEELAGLTTSCWPAWAARRWRRRSSPGPSGSG